MSADATYICPLARDVYLAHDDLLESGVESFVTEEGQCSDCGPVNSSNSGVVGFDLSFVRFVGF